MTEEKDSQADPGPCRRVALFTVCTVVAVALTPVAMGASRPAPAATQPAARVLRFPADRSLGVLYVHDAADSGPGSRDEEDQRGRSVTQALGEARGHVVVPARGQVTLFVHRSAIEDLSPLTGLAPDDLHTLSLSNLPVDDRCMPHVGRLTGLKVLRLERTNIGSAGLRHVRGMSGLEVLTLPNLVTDAGLVHVGGLRSLKRLQFSLNRVTDKGLVHLEKLTALEALRLGGRGQDESGKPLPSLITDQGLAHITGLPRLRELELWGDFTDAALLHVKNIGGLRKLDLGHLSITDAGIKHLVACAELESLDLFDTRVTDAGVEQLVALRRLKHLNLGKKANMDYRRPPITDVGAKHLSEIQTLEHLALPPLGITDAGLAELARLEGLRSLRVGTNSASPIGDAGLAHLERLQSLESLSLCGTRIHDAGIAALAKLAGLRELFVGDFADVGVEGLSALGGLKHLESLQLETQRMPLSAVNRLVKLPALRRMTLQFLTRDGSTLQLSGLPRLESLRLDMAEGSRVTDADLACVADMITLKSLQVSGFGGHSELTDAAFARLTRLTAMERLTLGGPAVTDKALDCLSGMQRLQELNTFGNFTDAALRHLEQLRSLRYLRINSSGQFSPDAIARLRAALPELVALSADQNRALAATTHPAPARQVQVGHPAPAFTVETLDGKTATLADYRGKVLLVYFWATWCSPCMTSMPGLKEFQAEMSGECREFAMLSVSMDDDTERFRSYLRQQAFAWPQARVGRDSKLAADYGVDGAPAYVVIGPDGKVLSTSKSWHDLQKAIAEACKR